MALHPCSAQTRFDLRFLLEKVRSLYHGTAKRSLQHILRRHPRPSLPSALHRSQSQSSDKEAFCSHLFPVDANDSAQHRSKVAIISDPACLFHESPGHPESPDRIRAVLEALNSPEMRIDGAPLSDSLTFVDRPTQITRSRLTMAHSQLFVDDILEKARDAAEQNQTFHIDGVTFISPHSAQSIMAAVASVCFAVDIVLNDSDDNNPYKVQ